MTKRHVGKPEIDDDHDEYRIAANTVCELLPLEARETWRTPFQTAFLGVYHELGKKLVQHSRLLATSRAIPRVDVSPTVLHAVFATDRPDHAFQQEPLRWGFGLTEPMATKTLARLLSAGHGEIRAKRIQAFLQALGLPKGCASLRALERCRIYAEQDHIDLKLHWKDDAGLDVIVIIEAKFGHKVTKKQLRGYWESVRQVHARRPFASVLLTLDDSARTALIGRQRTNWKQVDWRNFWLRFERLRPIEHDAALQMFLTTLWHRIGCLTQKDRHGRI